MSVWTALSERIRIDPVEVHVFLIRFGGSWRLDRALRRLSADEQETAMGYSSPSRRLLYVRNRDGLRSLLGWLLRESPNLVRLGRDPYGRPVLDGGPLLIATAGGHDRLLVAVSTHRVGVSLQQVPDSVSDDAMRLLSLDERRLVAGCRPSTQPRALVRLFNRKQAVLQLSGLSLSEAARVQAGSHGGTQQMVILDNGPDRTAPAVVNVHDLPDDHAAMAALATHEPRPIIRAWVANYGKISAWGSGRDHTRDDGSMLDSRQAPAANRYAPESS